MQGIVNKKSTSKQSNWIKEQIYSKYHILTITIFVLTCSIYIYALELGVIITSIALITTFIIKIRRFFVSALIGIVITTIASFINPILGVVVSIIFLIIKIKYIAKRLKAIIYGVFLYVSPYIVGIMCEATNYTRIDNTSDKIPFFIVIGLMGIALHFMMANLYKDNYSSKKAISTMCFAPVIIVFTIIPLIVSIIDSLSDDIMIDSDYDFDDIDEYDTHTVKGHIRRNSNGTFSYIKPHIRSNPDGIESNNISYKK